MTSPTEEEIVARADDIVIELRKMAIAASNARDHAYADAVIVATNLITSLHSIIREKDRRIEDAELALGTWDSSRTSEYWLRHSARSSLSDGVK